MKLFYCVYVGIMGITMLFLNNKYLLNLPCEVINEIIKYLSPHPVSLLIQNHIYSLKLNNCENEWRCSKYFYESFFIFRRQTISCFDYELQLSLLQIKKVKFIKKYCLECSTTYVEAEEIWNIDNNIHDESDESDESDNENNSMSTFNY